MDAMSLACTWQYERKMGLIVRLRVASGLGLYPDCKLASPCGVKL